MPMRDELPPAPIRARAVTQPIAASNTTIAGSELHLVVLVCAVGYLITLNVMLRVPDIGSILAAYSIY
jgi:hypothetical protein